MNVSSDVTNADMNGRDEVSEAGATCPKCGSTNVTEVVISKGGRPRTITADTPPSKICAHCGHIWK